MTYHDPELDDLVPIKVPKRVLRFIQAAEIKHKMSLAEAADYLLYKGHHFDQRIASKRKEILEGDFNAGVLTADQMGQPYTCDTCSAALECEYAFDGYNTDGDCLAEK